MKKAVQKRGLPNKLFPGLPHYVGLTSGWFGLLHHADDPIEWSDNVMDRVRFVREHKPPHEVTTRLRAIVLIDPLSLPRACRKAAAAWSKANVVASIKALSRADATLFRTEAAWSKSLVDHRDEITALLHKLVPNCPWNGRKIVFPKK